MHSDQNLEHLRRMSLGPKSFARSLPGGVVESYRVHSYDGWRWCFGGRFGTSTCLPWAAIDSDVPSQVRDMYSTIASPPSNHGRVADQGSLNGQRAGWGTELGVRTNRIRSNLGVLGEIWVQESFHNNIMGWDELNPGQLPRSGPFWVPQRSHLAGYMEKRQREKSLAIFRPGFRLQD